MFTARDTLSNKRVTTVIIWWITFFLIFIDIIYNIDETI